MGPKTPGWQLPAFLWTARYWSFVCCSFVLLPVWVTYINREDDFSPGDQLGLVASLFPAVVGLALGYSLHRLSRMARTNPGSAGDVGEHLGVGLIILSLGTMVLSLLTFQGGLFLVFIVILLFPAGVFTGTSAELAKSVP